MQLHKLTLQNFCQHEHLEASFIPGLNGIVGPNWSGKTNLIKAIHLAVTNRSNNNGTREQDVRQGSSGESLVELEGSLAGRDFRVRRLLSPKSKSELIASDLSEPLTNANKIQEWFEFRLQAPLDVFSRLSFAWQNKIFQALSDTPTARFRAFQVLLGLDRFEELFQVVDKSEKTLAVASARYSFIDQQLPEAVAGVACYTEELKEKERDLSQVKLFTDEQVKKIEQKLSSPRERASVQESMALVEEAVKSLTKDVRLFSGREQALIESLEIATGKEVSAQAYAEASQQLSQHRRASKHWAKLSSNRKAQEDVVKSLEQVGAIDGAIVQATKESLSQSSRLLAQLEQQAERAEQDERELEEVACPTCHRPWRSEEERLQLLEAAKEKKIELTSKVSKVKTKEVSLRTKLQKLEEQGKERAKLNSILSSLQETERSLQDDEIEPSWILPEGKQSCLQDLLETAEASRQQVQQIREDLTTAKLNRARAIASLEAKIGERSQLEKRLQAIPEVSEEKLAQLRRMLKRQQQQQNRKTELLAEVKLIKKRLQERQDELQALQSQEKEAKKAEARHARMARLKAALHPSGVPLQILHDAFQEISRGMLPFLKDLGSPFLVRPTEDLSFDVVLPSGVISPASRLSGAQETLLALPFVISAVQWATGDQGLLVLDEPTVGLNQANVARLRDALVSVKSSIHARGFQILLVTHEEVLVHACDHIIRVDAKDAAA